MIKRFIKSRNIKRIAIVLLVLVATSFLFNWDWGITNAVFAADGVDKTDFVQIIDLLLKIIYVLLWPLLWIAGTALDNSMVYASFLHMDAPLWKFWNIIKNFANFTLWFVILFAIIKNIFSFGKWDQKPQAVITKALIAWVLIQASWFIMAALIDLSTIATYAIWGLPLNVLWSTDLWNFKILEVHSSLDLKNLDTKDKDQKYFKVWYSTKFQWTWIYLSECRQEKWYILWRSSDDIKFDKTAFGKWKNACVLWWWSPVILNEFNFRDLKWYSEWNIAKYQDWVMDSIDKEVLEACGFIVRTNSKKSTTKSCNSFSQTIIDAQSEFNSSGPEADDTEDFGKIVTQLNSINSIDDIWTTAWKDWLDNKADAMSLDKLIKWSKWFVWPLVTIYSSMLDFAQISNSPVTTSFGEISWEMIIKMLFAVWLIFPLLALAIVLIIRIWFLRVTIVLSPFLVLVETFKRWDKIWWDLQKHFNIKNIIKVIFAPVMTVFALSISLIFMSTLIVSLNAHQWWETKVDIWKEMWVTTIKTDDPNEQKFWLMWWSTLSIMWETWTVWGTLDWFSWFLVNLLGIWLMRSLVFIAIKSNTIWEEFGGKVETFGASMFQTLPIVPIWWWEKVWFGTLGSVSKTYPLQIANDRSNKQVQDTLDTWDKARMWSITWDEAKSIVNSINTNSTKEDIEKIIADKANIKERNITNLAWGDVVWNFYAAINELSGNKAEIAERLAPAVWYDKDWFQKQTLDDNLSWVGNTLADVNIAKEKLKNVNKENIKDKDSNLVTYEREFDWKTYALKENSWTLEFKEK